MKWFRTRKEVKYLRQDIAELREMLVDHFGILYRLEDFNKYADRHPKSKTIPITEGEWYHFREMISPSGADIRKIDHLNYRTIPLVVKKDKP